VAGTKKDKETMENTEHAERQINFFREFRAFRSCQKLIVVGRLSGNVFLLFAVSSTDDLPFRQTWALIEPQKGAKSHKKAVAFASGPSHHKNAVAARYTCPLPLAGRPAVSSVSEASFFR